MGSTAANANVSPLVIAPSPLPAAPPPPQEKPSATQETGNRKGRRPPKEGAVVGSNCASITTVTVQRGSFSSSTTGTVSKNYVKGYIVCQIPGRRLLEGCSFPSSARRNNAHTSVKLYKFILKAC